MDLIQELGWDQWLFTTKDIIGLVVVYAIIVASLLLYSYAKNRWSCVDPRKIVHIGVGQFVWIWWIFSAPWTMLVFFTIPFTALLFFAMFDTNPIGRSKLGQISGEGHKTGLFYYALAITVLVLLCFNHWIAATIGVVAMTVGDGCGSIIGKKFGKHKSFRGKSWEGSLAVFVATALVSALIIMLYTYLSANGISRPMNLSTLIDWWWAPLIAGLVAAASEAICDGDYDNIVVAGLVTLAMIGVGF